MTRTLLVFAAAAAAAVGALAVSAELHDRNTRKRDRQLRAKAKVEDRIAHDWAQSPDPSPHAQELMRLDQAARRFRAVPREAPNWGESEHR